MNLKNETESDPGSLEHILDEGEENVIEEGHILVGSEQFGYGIQLVGNYSNI